MVKSTALMVAILSALPASAIAQSACGGPREMTVCESELYDAGVTWEGRAREGRVQLSGCLEKLRTRTSTVINNLVLPPVPAATNWRDIALIAAVTGISGLGLGALLGVLLSQ